MCCFPSVLWPSRVSSAHDTCVCLSSSACASQTSLEAAVAAIVPDDQDNDGADADEDDVQAEYQAVDDGADHLPLLREFALMEAIVNLQADGRQVLGQLLQLCQGGVVGGFN